MPLAAWQRDLWDRVVLRTVASVNSAAVLASHWPVVVLFCWLWFHRLVVHRGFSDLLDLRHGTSPFTTWAVVIETVTVATVCLVAGWVPLHPYVLPVIIAGNVLIGMACVVGYSARRTLGKHFSIHLTTGGEHELVTAGIYGHVRHPVYTGDLLFHLAVPLMTCTYEALLFAPIYFLLIRQRMITEEKMLSAQYPDYAAYMKRTARLIPGVY